MRVLSAPEIRAFLRRSGFPAAAQRLEGLGDFYAGNGQPRGYPGGPGSYSEDAIFGCHGTPADVSSALAAPSAAPSAIPGPASAPLAAAGPPVRVTIATYPFTGQANSGQVTTINPRRALLIVQNLDSATNLYVGFGAPASLTSMVLLPTVGVIFDTAVPVDAVAVWFAGGAAKAGVVLEGVPYTGS